MSSPSANSIPAISVVVCTRNPRATVFRRVLDCLAAQAFPAAHWELIVVDNGSEPPVAVGEHSGPTSIRIVREPKPGLTPARIRGIRAARGELLIFVDDDNLLDSRYLEQAARIAGEFPSIGAFGGRITPEFEV
ncbi:MAG: glycosyltransferase, partial [Planctomycetia bacterium]